MATGSYAQVINGFWKGTLTQQPGGCFSTYNVELQITVNKSELSGFCYHYSDVTNYVKKNYTGVYNAQKNTIQIQEQKVMTFHIPQDCTPCIRYFSLAYHRDDTKETLTGDWGGTVLNGNATCTPGKITLHRIVASEFAHIKEIKVDTGSIRLDFYDNAIIDGDSITILLNNKIIAEHQLLGINPITLFVRMELDQREQEITMVAENLGSIPPNTALVIITAGGKKYQLFLDSDKRQSAQVRFVYQRPEQ
ncbi:MAG: hypothetical protein NVS1B13_03220 [Flavisolibacter sp.]